MRVKQGINLIPSSVLAARARRLRLRVWIGVHALLLAGAATALVVARPRTDGLVERLHREHEEARTLLAQSQESLAHTVERLREARQRQAVAQRIGARPDFSGLLQALSQQLDPRAQLEQVLIAPLVVEPEATAPTVATADPASPPAEGTPPPPIPVREEYQVMIAGIATNAGVASEYLLRLDRTGYFSGVHLASTSPRQIGEARAVEFRIVGVLGRPLLADAKLSRDDATEPNP